jgi:hypothetical protein
MELLLVATVHESTDGRVHGQSTDIMVGGLLGFDAFPYLISVTGNETPESIPGVDAGGVEFTNGRCSRVVEFTSGDTSLVARVVVDPEHKETPLYLSVKAF